MRGCEFAKFDGDESVAEQFIRAQDPNEFSRDPYVQLERYYENVGKDIQARDIHYRGRLALRENATRKGDYNAKWSYGRSVSDWLLKVLTGYGVYTGRIVSAIILFILLGAAVFSLDEVFPVSQALVATPSEVSAASGNQKPLPEPNALDGFFYSVDRAVPINMGVENELEPRPRWSEAYSLAHAVFGWLLIALFLASWTGLVRRSSR